MKKWRYRENRSIGLLIGINYRSMASKRRSRHVNQWRVVNYYWNGNRRSFFYNLRRQLQNIQTKPLFDILLI